MNNERMVEFRTDGLFTLLQTLFTKKNWLPNGISFPSSALEDGLRKRFQLPVYTDTVLRAGVYLNFREFKENKPSIQNVQIQAGGNLTTKVWDSSGKMLDLKKIWGVCDGGKRYIVFRDDLCELVPSDKSFRFFSYTQAKDLSGQAGYGDYATQNGLLGAAIIKAMDNPINREYFYLNMDEEEVHLEELFGKSRLKSLQKEILK